MWSHGWILILAVAVSSSLSFHKSPLHFHTSEYISPRQTVFISTTRLCAGKGKAWSSDEMDALVAMRHEGKDLRDISVALNRTVAACRTRYQFYRPHLQWPETLREAVLSAIVAVGEDWDEVGRRAELHPKSCRIFYLAFLRGNLERGQPWTEHEDERLLGMCSAATGDAELPVTPYLNILPLNSWRNVSHLMMRSSLSCRKRYCQLALSRDTATLSDVWYDGEHRRLLELVALWGPAWRQIGRELGRTEMQCYNKYHGALSSGGAASDPLSSGATAKSRREWTASEDRELLKAYKAHGNAWSKIALVVQRPSRQCFQRWKILSVAGGGSCSSGWTEDQKKELCRKVGELGARWTTIGAALNRSAYVCRAAYQRVVDKSSGDDDDLGLGLSMPRAVAAKSVAVLSPDTETQGLRPWSRSEDKMLRQLVTDFGHRWDLLAEKMGRSPEDVMLRHDFKLAARRWTPLEDDKLLTLVELFGRKWAQIAVLMDRSEAQCAMRFRLQLDPRLKTKAWARQEDERLLSLHNDLGYSFGMISAVLDRTGPSCRYRFAKLTGKLQATAASHANE